MARKIFVDTWGWLVMRDKGEARHYEVADFYRQFLMRGGYVYTTDYVLDEAFTLMFKRLPFPKARRFIEMLDRAVQEGYLYLERITPMRFAQTKSLRLKFHDKPQISFTDLSSMVVMQELGLSMIVTGDAHFSHVGMGFQIVP